MLGVILVWSPWFGHAERKEVIKILEVSDELLKAIVDLSVLFLEGPLYEFR